MPDPEAPPAPDAVSGDTQTVPAFPSDTTPPAESPDFAGFIPDDYKEKSWVKELKDADSLFKMAEDQKAALGRRPAGIPEDNATAEQRAEFYKAFGKPEKPEDYKFPDLAEGDTKGAEFQTKIQAAFHGADLNLKQAEKLTASFVDIAPGISEEAQEAEFEKLADAEFGVDRDKILKEAQELVTRFTPESLKGGIDKMSNAEQLRLAAVLKGIRAEYISEDSIPSGDGAPSTTQADRVAEATAIMADLKDPYHDVMHPLFASRREHVNKLFGTHKEK